MPSADVGGEAADCRGRQSAVWHARREFELLTLLAHEGDEETRRLFLRLRRQRHLTPPEAKQAAGRRAKPAPARAQAVPKRKTTAQLARSERKWERLRQKHLARVERVRPRLQAWLCRARARASLAQPMEHAPPATPAGPSVAVPEPGAELPPYRAEVDADTAHGSSQEQVTYLSITKMAAYQGKSFEELRWEHYSKDNNLEAQPPAEPPAAAQPAPPTQPPSPTALAAAARARLDASELQDDRGSKRSVLARTPPSATAPERPPPPADARKRPATRGGACLEAALARAAPAAEPEVQPITADNYAAAALAAAANPHPPPA